jgi:hypothetical protein
MTLELPGWAGPLVAECRSCGEDVDAALKPAADYGRLLPQPGGGQTTRPAEATLKGAAALIDTAERTIGHVGHALGPAPLGFDEDHARRVADLELYVRQHHAERDLARLGAAVLAGSAA